MAWATPSSSIFLAAGQSVQWELTFSGNAWAGPQFITARLDSSSGDTGRRMLVIQWQGTLDEEVGPGPPAFKYAVGINNPSDVDIWFHLEGGAVP